MEKKVVRRAVKKETTGTTGRRVVLHHFCVLKYFSILITARCLFSTTQTISHASNASNPVLSILSMNERLLVLGKIVSCDCFHLLHLPFLSPIDSSLPLEQKMWFQHLIPSMEKEIEDHGSDGLAALLEVVLLMASECTRDEYQSYLLPFLRNVFSMTKSIQVSQYLWQSNSPSSFHHFCLNILWLTHVLVEKKKKNNWTNTTEIRLEKINWLTKKIAFLFFSF